ncbi:MAG: hypothetical protein ACFCGT_13935 [Sandaracinaceae bacterium]
MRILISRLDPKTHRFVVERPPHPTIDVRLETRSLLLHDLAHYAVEGHLATEEGFYGRLASGASLEELRGDLPEEVQDALMMIERRVAMLQTAFKKRRPTADPALQRLREVWGAWSKIRQGQALELPWPAGPPRLTEVAAANADQRQARTGRAQPNHPSRQK